MGMAKEEFQKSLARLESLTKAQLFHTASDSSPGQWAGTASQDEDSMDDNIAENGTDYDGVKKALAAKLERTQRLSKAEIAIIKGTNPYGFIREKISKGEGLTGAERWVLKGAGREVFKGMENSPKKDGAGEENKEARNVPTLNVANKDDGKENAEVSPGSKAEKSLAAAARQQPQLSKAIDMSPVMHELVVALGHALEGQRAEVVKSVTVALDRVLDRVGAVEKSLMSIAANQDEFNKSMGTAMVGIGEHVVGQAEAAVAGGHMPARGPISAMRPGGQGDAGGQIIPIQKSFGGPGGLEDGEAAISKSQLSNIMVDMVKGGEIGPAEVIKFESTGQMSPDVQRLVANRVQKAGQR